MQDDYAKFMQGDNAKFMQEDYANIAKSKYSKSEKNEKSQGKGNILHFFLSILNVVVGGAVHVVHTRCLSEWQSPEYLVRYCTEGHTNHVFEYRRLRSRSGYKVVSVLAD